MECGAIDTYMTGHWRRVFFDSFEVDDPVGDPVVNSFTMPDETPSQCQIRLRRNERQTKQGDLASLRDHGTACLKVRRDRCRLSPCRSQVPAGERPARTSRSVMPFDATL